MAQARDAESDLAGRVALVTGASGGIGRALAARMLDAGARVALHYSSSGQAVNELVAHARDDGATALGVQADLSEADACGRLVGEVADRLGPVEVLVVNHGRGVKRADYEAVTAGEWDTTMAVNTRAAFLLVQAVRATPASLRRGCPSGGSAALRRSPIWLSRSSATDT